MPATLTWLTFMRSLPIRQKVRLHICDGLNAQYDGGPSFMPQWMWPFNGLLVSRDPVALDYVGWKIIEKKRAEVGMKPLAELKREPAYIATAADAEHRLGTCDPKRIEQGGNDHDGTVLELAPALPTLSPKGLKTPGPTADRICDEGK
jgi:hypothetical protein